MSEFDEGTVAYKCDDIWTFVVSSSMAYNQYIYPWVWSKD